MPVEFNAHAAPGQAPSTGRAHADFQPTLLVGAGGLEPPAPCL